MKHDDVLGLLPRVAAHPIEEVFGWLKGGLSSLEVGGRTVAVRSVVAQQLMFAREHLADRPVRLVACWSQGSGGVGTSRLLNEFCVASGYHREYANRLLRHGPPPPRSEHRRLDRDAGASANVSSGYEIMQQLAYAYATLVEDGASSTRSAMPKSGSAGFRAEVACVAT